MSDSWPVCPSCKALNSVMNIVPEHPSLWTPVQVRNLGKWLFCTECGKFVKEKDVKHVHSNDDEVDEKEFLVLPPETFKDVLSIPGISPEKEFERENIKDAMPDDEGDKS